MKTSYMDLYCERMGPEYWAEPLNAVTNLMFIFSAVAITVLLVRTVDRNRGRGALWVLNGLIYGIGIGSWLFHTHAVLWAMLADIIPIGVFILLASWVSFRQLAGFGLVVSGLGVGVVVAIAILVHVLSGYEGGAYVAALFALFSIGTYLEYRRPRSAGKAFLWGGALFAISLAFRSLDQSVCDQISIGTHFVWHILNSIVLFIVVRALMTHGHAAR